MKLLLDTNVVLDVLLQRTPWVVHAQAIWQAHDQKQIKAFVTATTITDIFYIARRGHGYEKANQAIDACLKAFEICSVNKQALILARAFPGNDFEDNLQIACATVAGLDGIVTRNPADFSHATITIFSPEDVVEQLKNIE